VTSPVATDQIAEILEAAKTIAVVGLSNSPLRPSYGVAAYLQTHGYDIVPVNPTINGALGKKSCPSLSEVTAKVDIVDIFRRSEFVESIVDEAIARGDVKCIWMQEDVVNERAAEKARKAGIFVVMDRCILKEHRRRHH
jgi:predicted CoA-binding protein